jgi:hypothetical protein
VLFFPRVLVAFVGLKGRLTHGGRGHRRMQVRLHAVSQGVHLLARHPQFTRKTRGWFPFRNAAEEQHQRGWALPGLGQGGVGQEHIIAVTGSATVGWDGALWPEMDACCGTDLEAMSVDILAWVLRRWSVEVTCADARAHLGFEPPRQRSDKAIARATPDLWGLCALVTLLALQRSHRAPMPVSATAWYRHVEPTFTDCLALVHQQLWRARAAGHALPAPESRPSPLEVLVLLIPCLQSAASLVNVE